MLEIIVCHRIILIVMHLHIRPARVIIQPSGIAVKHVVICREYIHLIAYIRYVVIHGTCHIRPACRILHPVSREKMLYPRRVVISVHKTALVTHLLFKLRVLKFRVKNRGAQYELVRSSPALLPQLYGKR